MSEEGKAVMNTNQVKMPKYVKDIYMAIMKGTHKNGFKHTFHFINGTKLVVRFNVEGK